MKIGITCYPTYGGSGALATELGLDLVAARARGALHHLRDAVPAPRLHRAGLLPRGGHQHRPLPAVRALSLYAGARLQAARGGAAGGARRAARALRHPPRHHGLARPRDARQPSTRSRSSPRCTAPTSPWWGRRKASTPSPSSPSSAPTRSPPSRRILRDETVRTFGCGQCRIEVIPNFVNLTEYSRRGPQGARRALPRRTTS